ncbi:MAG: hypothetical protein ACT6Q8_15995 [Niveispirillum sp.]|uniref:hypothetical protein n=1 Tax=Niveispirillum sp. TaxID=1917217 RepID=UPI0040352420
MIKMKKAAILLMCAATILPGCSKTEEKTPQAQEDSPVSLSDATSTSKAKEAIEEKQAAAVPMADKSVPLSSYKAMESGRALMFAHLAADTLPLDYEKIAARISDDYRSEEDVFKKNDLLQALKPAIDAEVTKSKSNMYYYMMDDDGVSSYDFATKSFQIPRLSTSGNYTYFYDNSSFKLEYSNPVEFSRVEVTDETRARLIEKLRSQARGLMTKVYFFASSTELGSPIVKAEITKVQILDRQGNVLAER